MSKSSSRGSFGRSGSSKAVSAARLHQKSGTTFGGYTKVNKGNGNFTMKPAGTKKGSGK